MSAIERMSKLFQQYSGGVGVTPQEWSNIEAEINDLRRRLAAALDKGETVDAKVLELIQSLTESQMAAEIVRLRAALAAAEGSAKDQYDLLADMYDKVTNRAQAAEARAALAPTEAEIDALRLALELVDKAYRQVNEGPHPLSAAFGYVRRVLRLRREAALRGEGQPEPVDWRKRAERAEAALQSPDLRERLADVQHDIWSHWMLYLFSRCNTMWDGAVKIPPGKAERWKRQAATPYANLPEHERDSDREQADKVLAALRGGEAQP